MLHFLSFPCLSFPSPTVLPFERGTECLKGGQHSEYSDVADHLKMADYLLESLLVGSFALGWISCFMTLRLTRPTVKSKQASTEIVVKAQGSQTMSENTTVATRPLAGERIKVFPTGEVYHRLNCRYAASRPNEGAVYRPCTVCFRGV